MKKFFSVTIGLLLITAGVVVAVKISALERHAIMLEQHISALEQYTRAQIYKKDAQLYLMNTAYGNKDMHRALADSCKNDCLKHKEAYE